MGKNYNSKTPNYHVTPVGKFKLEEARGDKFYDATRQLGGLHWTSFKGKGMYHFQSVPVDENGKVIEKDAKHLGSTKITKKNNIKAYGSIWLTVPDAEWIQKNLPVGTKVLIYGEDASSDNFIADNAKH